MPKMKSNRGAAKRFRRTGTGRLRRMRACKSHILTKKKKKRKPLVMDPDHRLLLRSVKPLLQSRNASVSGVEVGQWGWGWGEGGAMVCSEVNVGGVTRV